MKIQVQWRTEIPTATEIAGPVSEKIRYPVMPEYDQQYRKHRLVIECESLSDLDTSVDSGIPLANGITQYLWDNYQIHGERMVEGWDIGAHACLLERRIQHLETAVGKAVADLKQTRTWLKDGRFAVIRRGLEEALAAPLL